MQRGIGWAAGLFEGEGTIAPRRTNAPHAWQLALTSTDEDVVRAFHEVVEHGKVYGPYGYRSESGRDRSGHKQYWRWSVSDQRGIEEVGRRLRPYLLGRRRERLEECLMKVAKTPFTRQPHQRASC